MAYFLLGILFSVIFYFVIQGINKLRFHNKRDPDFFIKKFQRASFMEKIDIFLRRCNTIFITVIIVLIGIIIIDYVAQNIKLQFNLAGYILLMIIILALTYIGFGFLKKFEEKKGYWLDYSYPFYWKNDVPDLLLFTKQILRLKS